MHRWLAIFLLVFLPLQSAWAAASVYCQHESGSAARHFGHHVHQHAASGDPAGTGSDTSGQNTDKDCGFHLNGFNGFISQRHFPVLLAASVFGEVHSPSYTSYIPDGPERPDIALAAQ